MTKWDYKVKNYHNSLSADGRVEDMLNTEGSRGWELVNIVPQYGHISSDANDRQRIDVEFNSFIFKRQKQ